MNLNADLFLFWNQVLQRQDWFLKDNSAIHF